MQQFAAQISSKLLDQMGVWHMRQGVVIATGAKLYEVEGACSGITSLLTTLACVLFYCLYYRIHWLRATLLTASSVFWVLINNITRIIIVAYSGAKWDIDLAHGLPHQIIGFVLFALTLVFLWSTDRLLMFFGQSDLPRRRFEPLANALPSSNTERSFQIGGAFF